VIARPIMPVPCIVKTWLYCCALRMCWPGRASWARMVSPSMPSNKNMTNAVPRVRIPMRL